MKVLYGARRVVVLWWRWAFKFPRFGNYGYGRINCLLRSLASNASEYYWWKTFRDKRACPIVFHLPFGLLNVMRQCRPLGVRDFLLLRDDPKLRAQFEGIPVEDKEDSYGVHPTRGIVAIDYDS